MTFTISTACKSNNGASQSGNSSPVAAGIVDGNVNQILGHDLSNHFKLFISGLKGVMGPTERQSDE